jgi:hypothetical protein
MTNVIGTIAGRRPERIVLAKPLRHQARAPFRFLGANDGASSTAALLELGRALAASNPLSRSSSSFSTARKAVNWGLGRAADNTYGSRHYVSTAQKAGTLAGVKALVLLDMIGDRDLGHPARVRIRRHGWWTPSGPPPRAPATAARSSTS